MLNVQCMLNVRRGLCVVAFALVGCHKNTEPAPLGAGGALASGAVLPSDAPGNSLAILDGFEGEISMSARGKFGGKQAATVPTSFTLHVKDGKFRVDLPASLADAQGIGKAYALVAPADKKLYLVMDAKQQVILVDFDKFAQQAKAFTDARRHSAAGTADVANLQKTGKTDTVAGYKCEIWHITQAKSSTDLCIAEQGTSWFHLPLSGLPAELAWATEITDGKHFPLRLVMSDNGVEEGRLEVTRIQKQSLPASEFAVPAGYNVVDLQQMLGAMMGGMGGMVPGGMVPGGMVPGAMPSGLAPGMPPAMQRPVTHVLKKP
jgi:Domain of unknown function (DUF4412)